MALYKYEMFLQPSQDDAFDRLTEPGVAAPWPGIYRCHVCGHEIAIAAQHTLPSQNHSQHPNREPIQWRLIVSHRKF
jgi:hypothetical protein